MVATEPFKVIVVGGGPVGLTAAHALHAAGIDFVLLERRSSMVEKSGASLVLDPTTMRVMSQLGLTGRLEPLAVQVGRAQSLTKDGYMFKDTDNTTIIAKWCGAQNEPKLFLAKLTWRKTSSLGAAPYIFHRAELTKSLYDGLPKVAKDRIHPGKKVVDITTGDDSVSVTCDDGSSFHGSIVIGADGVYSKTRRLMMKASGESDENPFVAKYRCLWCSFPRPESSPPGLACDTQGQDHSAMYLAGVDKAWIFLYELLPQPTKERASYTGQDIDDMVARFADDHLTDKIQVKDVFNRDTAGMSNLDEGIAPRWSSGRIVLAGDACHKFAPNAGAGFNTGIQDVVALCNRLRDLLHQKDDGGDNDNDNNNINSGGVSPSVDELGRIFDEYRTARKEGVKSEYGRSVLVSRTQAWANTLYWVVARYVLSISLLESLVIRFLAVREIRKGLVLEYVRGEEPFHGPVSFVNPIKPWEPDTDKMSQGC